MMRRLFFRLSTLAFFGLCSCAPRSTFILLPSDDGRPSAIVVATKTGEQVLDRPYQMTSVTDGNAAPAPPTGVSPEEISHRYGTLLAGLPSPPEHFILYFVNESTLTPDSQALLPDILRAVRTRHSTDISIIGHTDTSGSADYNYRLSRARAEEVATMLVAAGVTRETIQVDSHGEANLLIPTPDNTTEPRNRRVEVTVR